MVHGTSYSQTFLVRPGGPHCCDARCVPLPLESNWVPHGQASWGVTAEPRDPIGAGEWQGQGQSPQVGTRFPPIQWVAGLNTRNRHLTQAGVMLWEGFVFFWPPGGYPQHDASAPPAPLHCGGVGGNLRTVWVPLNSRSCPQPLPQLPFDGQLMPNSGGCRLRHFKFFFILSWLNDTTFYRVGVPRCLLPAKGGVGAGCLRHPGSPREHGRGQLAIRLETLRLPSSMR